jgi:hypothetical protein
VIQQLARLDIKLYIGKEFPVTQITEGQQVRR